MAEGEFAPIENRLEQALKLSGQPIKNGTMAHEHVLYAMLVDAAVIGRDDAALKKYLPPLEELAERDDHIPFQAVARRARGVLHRLAGELNEAQGHLEEALKLFTGLDARWQLGRTFYELGELQLARSQPEAAEDFFNQALAEFEALGAKPDVKRTREMVSSVIRP